MKPTLKYERALWSSGKVLVAGVDEVGRGAWAGPIVAGAVLISSVEFLRLKRQPWFKQVADSKLLSPVVRERIFVAAEREVVWSLGVVNNKVIDKVGIALANRQAVHLAVSKLKTKPDYVLVDYVARLGETVANVPARVIVDGDNKVFSIALASIIAKVSRDRLMVIYGKKYPGYGFAAHKGYGTPEHQQALAQLGVSPLHRRSYRPIQEYLL